MAGLPPQVRPRLIPRRLVPRRMWHSLHIAAAHFQVSLQVCSFRGRPSFFILQLQVQRHSYQIPYRNPAPERRMCHALLPMTDCFQIGLQAHRSTGRMRHPLLMPKVHIAWPLAQVRLRLIHRLLALRRMCHSLRLCHSFHNAVAFSQTTLQAYSPCEGLSLFIFLLQAQRCPYSTPQRSPAPGRRMCHALLPVPVFLLIGLQVHRFIRRMRHSLLFPKVSMA